jgi:hypothetical protein
MVSRHGHLYMNLTGHTLNGFGTLKSLHIWLSLVQVVDCWWCAQEAIITIRIKACRILDPSRIRVLMGLRLGSTLACSINTRGGSRGDIDAYTPRHDNPSCHLLSVKPQNPSYARGAGTPTRGVPSLYVSTPWGCYCSCYCADRLWWRGGCCWDEHEDETIVINSFLYTDVWLCWIAAPTLLPLHYASSVMIHDLLLASFLGWHSRSSARVDYLFPYRHEIKLSLIETISHLLFNSFPKFWLIPLFLFARSLLNILPFDH